MNLPLTSRIYFRLREIKLFYRYMKRLRKGEDMRHTAADSKDAYEEYDAFEQRFYETRSAKTLHKGRIKRLTFKEIREIYLREIYEQIEALIDTSKDKHIRILEVGCGNCINAMRLNQKYGSKIEYYGFDVSPRRIAVGKEYWGAELDGTKLEEMSVFDIKHSDNSFDIVFSMHVLEQLPYKVGDALDEMLRVAKKRLILIEPTYEFGNATQRLRVTLNDHLRTLLPELNERKVDFLKSYPLETLANSRNPSGVHVINTEK